MREIAEKIEGRLLEKGIIVKVEFRDDENLKSTYLISTPSAFKKKYLFIIVPGYPEIAGVWSFTLLSQDKLTESSMESYFIEFDRENWGLVALNPHYINGDLEGINYFNQLAYITQNLKPKTKFGFIGFSMGGRIIYDYLNKNKKILENLIGIVQIDPVIQSLNYDSNFMRSLVDRTILFASSTDKYQFGLKASILLNIPNIPIEGIHGILPSKCLGKIIDYFKNQVKKE